MKLLFCPHCGDIFNLSFKLKTCSCGRIKGKYIDSLNAVYTNGTPVCFHNDSFSQARLTQKTIDKIAPDTFFGERFDAWICPNNSKTFKRKKQIT